MEANKQYKVKSCVQLRKTNLEGLVFDSEKNKMHILNLTAFDVLELLNEDKSINDIAILMQEKYEVDFIRIKNDIYNIVEEFEKLGLILSMS